MTIGGDTALTLAEADEIAARAPCRVVLVAGEFESGKTTLVVELYAQFLDGPFAGASFGGSRTLRALDSRHHPARAMSGGTVPTTVATRDENMRVLHLRLRRHGRVHDLLLSDVRGEYFENIIDGAAAASEVPLAARADLCLLAIDGQLVAVPEERQRAITRARLLLGGLAEDGGLRAGAKTVIVVTKRDLLGTSARQWATDQLAQLRDWAVNRGLDASTAMIAARPEGARAEALDEILDAILPMPPAKSRPVSMPQPGDREFWNQPEDLA